MADNLVVKENRYERLTVASIESGDPVCVGQITGVALHDTAADGKVVIDRAGKYDLSVAAINAGGNSAVAIGDAIYFSAADTPKLNKKTAGVFFGYAVETITAGATATIEVTQKSADA